MRTFLQCTAIALLFLGCSKFSSNINSDDDLERLIEAEVQASLSGNIGLVSLMELDGFDWDQMLVLAPYSSIGEVEGQLGVNLGALGHFDIGQRDDVSLLVFLNGETPVRAVAYPRAAGDFAEVDPILIPRRYANFQIEPTPSGRVKMRLLGR